MRHGDVTKASFSSAAADLFASRPSGSGSSLMRTEGRTTFLKVKCTNGAVLPLSPFCLSSQLLHPLCEPRLAA